ncbi:MAG TPA: hypothetical protein VGT41_02835 [Candidatus Babeliales bacterium]|nr:hypothetical protein [Candidatus Babeliales bacterium]
MVSINYANIKKYDDLEEVFDANILITGSLARQKEEISENTWKVAFDDKFIQKLTIKDLEQFIERLVQTRIRQLERQMNHTPVTFYVWFDDMSLHLCFDFLSGKGIKLPFGCKLNLLSSIEPVLKSFLTEAQRAAIHGHVNIDDLIFFSPGDPGLDDEEPEWIQDVYVTTLQA